MLSHKQLFLLNTAQTSDFPRLLEVDRAEGCYIIDTQGKQYLDLVSGFAVSNLGHRYPKVIEAIKNQLDKEFRPLELGYDKWTNMTFGNKDFIINSINYLLDDNGLINIRNKKVNLPLLDKEKVYQQYTYTQIITVGLPIVILILFGIIITWVRRKKYSY